MIVKMQRPRQSTQNRTCLISGNLGSRGSMRVTRGQPQIVRERDPLRHRARALKR